MLTIFSIPKPFQGHIGTIQRNAVRSWTLLHPDVEVILFGNESGTAGAARELGVGHQPEVSTNKHGTPFLDSVFDRAQEIARRDLLCYVNCDIMLMVDFAQTAQRLFDWKKEFLMVGRRWDTDITEPWDFTRPDWQPQLKALVLRTGRQRQPNWIDYFVFPRGVYLEKIPPFVVGRPGWDNWLIWKTRSMGFPVVDASSTVIAVHQNHDYSHLPEGKESLWRGEEFAWNSRLAGRLWHYCTIENASHRLGDNGVQRNWRAGLARAKRDLLIARGYLRAGSRIFGTIRTLLDTKRSREADSGPWTS